MWNSTTATVNISIQCTIKDAYLIACMCRLHVHAIHGSRIYLSEIAVKPSAMAQSAAREVAA